MKLVQATQGQVVRNARNGSHYRFDRQERNRIRIRPLELFPSGLLVEKPTDTIVDGDIEVVLIGDWYEGMMVEGTPTHSRKTYERELASLLEKLPQLEDEYEQLPPGGKGRLSRGSQANKVKNCRARIDVIKTGLSFAGGTMQLARPETAQLHFPVKSLVQLPSGLPALVLSLMSDGGGSTMVQIRTRMQGRTHEGVVPTECLRPWSASRVCTV